MVFYIVNTTKLKWGDTMKKRTLRKISKSKSPLAVWQKLMYGYPEDEHIHQMGKSPLDQIYFHEWKRTYINYEEAHKLLYEKNKNGESTRV